MCHTGTNGMNEPIGVATTLPISQPRQKIYKHAIRNIDSKERCVPYRPILTPPCNTSHPSLTATIKTIQTTFARLAAQPTAAQGRQTSIPLATARTGKNGLNSPSCQTSPVFLRFFGWRGRGLGVLHLRRVRSKRQRYGLRKGNVLVVVDSLEEGNLAVVVGRSSPGLVGHMTFLLDEIEWEISCREDMWW